MLCERRPATYLMSTSKGKMPLITSGISEKRYDGPDKRDTKGTISPCAYVLPSAVSSFPRYAYAPRHSYDDAAARVGLRPCRFLLAFRDGVDRSLPAPRWPYRDADARASGLRVCFVCPCFSFFQVELSTSKGVTTSYRHFDVTDTLFVSGCQVSALRATHQPHTGTMPGCHIVGKNHIPAYHYWIDLWLLRRRDS